MIIKWLWNEVYYGGRYRFDALHLYWMGSCESINQQRRLKVEIMAGRCLENVRR